MNAVNADPLVGAIIADRYEVVRKIATGGMGVIYEVRNTRLGRTFALKTLTNSGAQDPSVLARFRREADVVASLSHPHIVEVVDWDQLDDGAPFLVMEYLRGESLAARIAAVGPLPWPQIARIADQVLSALGVAHRAGVVHRDLKPDNIFLATDDAGEERAKLLDFGISKIRDSQTFQTSESALLGTPAYMAPEQAEGQQDKIGPATDIWAIGAILYEMITGALAFAAPSAPAILYRICHGRPTPVNELRPDTPQALIELIDWTLEPQLRIDDVELLREKLRRVLGALEGVTWAAPMRSRMMDAARQTPLAIRAVTPLAIRAVTPLPVARARSQPRVPSEPAPSQPESPADAGPFAAEAAPLAAAIARPQAARTHARRQAPFWVAGLVAFGLSAAIVFVGLSGGDDAAPRAADPVHDTRPPPRDQGFAPTTPPAPKDHDPVAAPTVEARIESTPTGADVYRLPSEVKVGVTPWTDRLARGDGVAVFVVKAPGYRDAKVEIDLRKGGTQAAVLHANTSNRKRATTATPSTPERRKGEPVDPFSPPGTK